MADLDAPAESAHDAGGAADRWLREYALTALRIDRLATEGGGATVLIYRGPEKWRAAAAAEPPPDPARLAEDAGRLLGEIPFGPPRAAYLGAQVRAMRAVARALAGRRAAPGDHARDCLGVEPVPRPESDFAAAHGLLDAALPRTGGTLAGRLHAWQDRHALRRTDLLPDLLDRAVAECRRRTEAAFAALPAGASVEVRLVTEGGFQGAGHYAGGARGTLFVNTSVPFNLADLLYLVSHEVYPGHIAESMLKESHLVERRGLLDHRVRFMVSPSFVLSEGLGLHAQELVFPGDDAQRWLCDHLPAEAGAAPDDCDLAAVHRAKNVLWGVWANAALMAAEGRGEDEVAAYLTRWALLDEAGLAAALALVRAPAMGTYVLGYDLGRRIVAPWLAGPDRARRVRRLLTEQLLPVDLLPADSPLHPAPGAR
ncbi:hypothetical protein LG943_11250 [Streptomonospora sp. S1-112]|uniref:DUF885 domain-containing protein n=1 Tax=Streptomonospora mangrovi TaxID=2883123 RepID=A0A9X3NN87_9ACTN|nr:hypothetical protein [Streptomonospora mangrovi]MDA0564894.1 hypothetical protein [Streptomonospora mangrovi]